MKRTVLYLIIAGLLSAQSSHVFVATAEETAQAIASYNLMIDAQNDWADTQAQIKKNHHLASRYEINFNKDFTAFSSDGEGDDDKASVCPPNSCGFLLTVNQ